MFDGTLLSKVVVILAINKIIILGSQFVCKSMVQEVAIQAEFVTLLRVIGILGVAWVILGVFMIVYGIGYTPGTYLRVSSNGIEYRPWMSYRMRCGWQNLDSIERRYLPFGVPYDVLYAKDAEMSGFAWRFLTGFSRCFHQWRINYWIVLNLFEGWPEGNLAEDVRRYAPQLFDWEVLR